MMSSLDRANLLAGQAVSAAEAFIGQRQSAEQLAAFVDRMHVELASMCDHSIQTLLDPLRMLQIAMHRTAAHALALEVAVAQDGSGDFPIAENAGIIAARGLRWRAVMERLAELVRNESRTIAARRMADAASQPDALQGGQA